MSKSGGQTNMKIHLIVVQNEAEPGVRWVEFAMDEHTLHHAFEAWDAAHDKALDKYGKDNVRLVDVVVDESAVFDLPWETPTITAESVEQRKDTP